MPPSKFRTTADWFDSWAAGIALNTTYIQHGFLSRVIYLGKVLGERIGMLYAWGERLAYFDAVENVQITISRGAQRV